MASVVEDPTEGDCRNCAWCLAGENWNDGRRKSSTIRLAIFIQLSS